MKRIITLLLIVLVSNPVIGQITKQNGQEFENLTTSKIFKPIKTHQDRLKNSQTPDFNYNSNENIYAKSSLAEKKTLDSLISQEWDNDYDLWRNEFKEDFIYNGEKIETRILSLWDNNSSSWEHFQKTEYTFDSNGKVSSKITSYQFTPTVWVLDSKTEYTYFLNIDGIYKLSQEEEFAWDSSNNGQWVNTNKYELTYDSFETFVTLEVGYEWLSNQWSNMYRDEFFYDGLLSSEINSNWNYGTGEWDPHSKWEYFRNGLSPTETILYMRNTNNTEWVFQSKYEYESTIWVIAPVVLITKEIEFYWDTSTGQWIPDYKDEYEYDNNNNRTLGSYFEWNETPPGNWVEYGRDEFVFDLAYSFREDLIAPYNYAEEIDDTVFFFNNMVIGYLYFEYVNQVWQDSNKTLFYYADHTNQLSVDENILPNAISVYPNPATDNLAIDSKIPLTKVEMYSLLGKKVKEVNTDFKSIPINNLSDGIYIVKIQSENNVVLKK